MTSLHSKYGIPRSTEIDNHKVRFYYRQVPDRTADRELDTHTGEKPNEKPSSPDLNFEKSEQESKSTDEST